MNYIWWLIDKKIISSPTGSIFEISFYGAVLAVITYLQQCLSTGERGNRQIPTTMFFTSLVAGCLSWYSKQLRDLIKQKEEILDTVNIDKPEETII